MMIQYIIKDITNLSRSIPAGILVGLLFLAAACLREKKRGSVCGRIFAKVGYFALGCYLFLLLEVTLLNRINAGRTREVDLTLTSLFSFSGQIRAYAVENILLFVPLGFLLPFFTQKKSGFLRYLICGAGCSLFIELVQLLTARGLFQLEDILMNTVGTGIGYSFYILIYFIKHRRDNNE